jgi:hypothetical protein
MGKGGNKKAPSAKAASKAGLVEKNGALSPKFKAVLAEIFARFDKDRDGVLSIEELDAFGASSGTGSLDAEERKMMQLGTFFDTDAKGNLTLKGFEQMYLMQTNHNGADTWRDLEKLGYSRMLERRTEEGATQGDSEDLTKLRMDEMRAALIALKEDPDSADAHRRVGTALEALGRVDAAKKEFGVADELEARAQSTVNEQD